VMLSSKCQGALNSKSSKVGEMHGKAARVKLADLPDTSILYRRYLDAGKMINVYDWFESFKLVLDSRRVDDVSQVRSLFSSYLTVVRICTRALD
jgi:hypothetical protein